MEVEQEKSQWENVQVTEVVGTVEKIQKVVNFFHY